MRLGENDKQDAGAGSAARAPTSPGPSGSRPVDLVHLACQTLGDDALEREILGMFLHQLQTAVSRMPAVDENERRRLAHGLVGSARGVGAFALAECAAEIEACPANGEPVSRFAHLAEEVRAFVSALDG